jgi:hypothetical protein
MVARLDLRGLEPFDVGVAAAKTIVWSETE